MHHIDVSTVLRRTVCDLYSNLVTRPTGAAVRTEIEQLLREINGRTITVIDFSNVGLLDLSCADEIVAKLLLRYVPGGEQAEPDHEGYFLFRGVSDHHLDMIECVLERHRLALVAENESGEALLVGIVDDEERTLWEALMRRGAAQPADLALETMRPLDVVTARLEALCRRRLAMRVGEDYLAVGVAR